MKNRRKYTFYAPWFSIMSSLGLISYPYTISSIPELIVKRARLSFSLSSSNITVRGDGNISAACFSTYMQCTIPSCSFSRHSHHLADSPEAFDIALSYFENSLSDKMVNQKPSNYTGSKSEGVLKSWALSVLQPACFHFLTSFLHQYQVSQCGVLIVIGV